MLANLVALSDLSGSLLPECESHKLVRRGAEFFAEIVINALGAIPDYFAFARAKAAAMSLAWFTAHLANWKGLALEFSKALARAKSVLVNTAFVGSAIRLPAMGTDKRRLSLRYTIAFVGTMLSPSPFWQATSRWF